MVAKINEVLPYNIPKLIYVHATITKKFQFSATRSPTLKIIFVGYEDVNLVSSLSNPAYKVSKSEGNLIVYISTYVVYMYFTIH